MAGVDLSTLGNCPPPTNMFPCGYRFCIHAAQYCQKVIGGPVNNPGSYSCQPLPGSCGSSPGCPCLSGVTCGQLCMQSAAGDLTVTCLAP
jgi:hypothetical protein